MEFVLQRRIEPDPVEVDERVLGPEQERVLQNFRAGRLTAGQLMGALREAAVGPARAAPVASPAAAEARAPSASQRRAA